MPLFPQLLPAIQLDAVVDAVCIGKSRSLATYKRLRQVLLSAENASLTKPRALSLSLSLPLFLSLPSLFGVVAYPLSRGRGCAR